MSLLPQQDKDGQIKFVFLTSMPYRPRLIIIAILLAAGLSLQLFFGFLSGLFFLLAASVLGFIAGYDSRNKAVGPKKWERVTPNEYAKIKLKARQLERWDEDIFDITNSSGILILVLFFTVLLGTYVIVAGALKLPSGYWRYFVLDTAVLLIPLWFSGVRQYLRKDALLIKIDLLEKMIAVLSSPSETQVFPMLALVPTADGRTEPDDARLLVRLVGAPESFYGIQVQVSINTVCGRDYPYLYCVLMSAPGSGLLSGYKNYIPEPRPEPFLSGFFRLSASGGHKQSVYEPKSTPEADILVVRQYADKNSGYLTSPEAAFTILAEAIGMGSKLTKKIS